MANTENTTVSSDIASVEKEKNTKKVDKLGAKNGADDNGEETQGSFWKRNRKLFDIIFLAIIGLGVVIFALYKFVWIPRNERASDATQEQLKAVVNGGIMSNDTVALTNAVKGNEEIEGLLSVIDDYKLTNASAYSAKHYAALCYLKVGKKDEALNMLLECKKKDDYMWYETQMLIGDLYDEKGDVANAKKYYQKAIDGETGLVAPIALWKLGMLYERENKWVDAYNAYAQVKDKYYDRYTQMGVDKYYERAKAKAGK